MRHHAAFAAAALLMLAGCGREQAGEGGVTAEEREQLDNAAAMVDNQTFDTSADSLVLDENAANAGSTELNTLGAAAANEANAQ